MEKNKIKIRKGDNIIVIAGKHKGASGEVISIFPEKKKVIIRGVNMVKRHTKPSQASTGGIVEKEMPIDISNISFVDPKESKPTKIGFKILDDGRKVRFSKRSGEIIDA